MRARPWFLALLLALLLGGGPLFYFSFVAKGDSDRGNSGDSFETASTHTSDSDSGTNGFSDPTGDGDGNSGIAEATTDSTDGTPTDEATTDDATGPPVASPYRVNGTVVGADGREILGATVELFLHRAADARTGAFEELIRGLDAIEDAERPVATTRTDLTGRFELAADEPGEYRIGASLPPLARGVEGPFRLTPRDPRLDLLVVLGGGLSVTGTVETPDGRPVGGAEVSLLDRLEGEIPGRHYHAHHTISAADGSFVFDGLEARRYILTAAASGLARGLLPSVTPPLDDLRVEISAGRNLAIRVVRGRANGAIRLGPNGEIVPAPGIRVEGDGEPVVGAQVYALNPVGFAVATSDDQGIARFQLPGDEASLRITADGYRESRVTRLEIPVDIQTEPVEVTMTPVEPIDGVVLRYDGSPAAFASILEITGGLLSGGLRTQRADSAGHFWYNGGGALLAELDGEVSTLPDPRTGASTTLTLAPMVSITGRLIRPNGWPASGAEVRLTLNDFVGGGSESVLRFVGAQTSAFAGSDGRFLLEDVPPWGSALELVVYSDGSPDRRIPVSDDVGEIVLGEQAILEGRVVAPGGGAPPAAAVILELPGSPPVRRDPSSGTLRGGERVLVAEDGSFTIDRLSPTDGDPLVLHVVAPPYLEETRRVELTEGANGPIEIVLRGGGSARVHVVDDVGSPRAAAQVQLASGGRSGVRLGRTGPDGFALFVGLVPGTYSISADAGTEEGSTSAEISAGGVAEVEVTVE